MKEHNIEFFAEDDYSENMIVKCETFHYDYKHKTIFADNVEISFDNKNGKTVTISEIDGIVVNPYFVGFEENKIP